MSTTYPAILFVLLVVTPIFGLLNVSPTLNSEERARSSDTKTVSIFTKMGLADTVVNNLILVNSTKLSYGVGAIIGTIFLTAALYENGLFGSVFTNKVAFVDAANQVLDAEGRLGLSAANVADPNPTLDKEVQHVDAQQLDSSTDSSITSVLKQTSLSRYACKHYFKGSRKRRKR